MHLTRGADYALRVMIHLASRPAGTRESRESLARAGNVPASFMGKILQALQRANLIRSHRGVQGGFELARSGEEINVLQVVEALEGPIRLNTCALANNDCPRGTHCAGHAVWQEAQEAMVGVLRRATIARLAGRSGASARLQLAMCNAGGGSPWN